MSLYKGMIFAGCSFTWGQGLYFYSEIESLVYPKPNNSSFSISNITEYQIKFMESKRFPRIVADYFKSAEFVNNINGGSDKSNIIYWSDMIGNSRHYPFSDFSHFIFQFTHPLRSFTTFIHEGKEYRVIPNHEDNENYNLFTKWLSDNNIEFNTWYQSHIKDILDLVKEKLLLFEEHGIKTLVMSWPKEYIPYIQNDNFFNERFVNFEYKNITFDSIESLLFIPELKIQTDIKNLKRKILDEHPSLLCHRLIANNIIKKITKNDKTELRSI